MARRLAVEIGNREVTVSNLEKVYFPQTGFTKGEVIAFYADIAEYILPHLQQRPLTMLRMPEGVQGESFYEKNAPAHTPDWVRTFAVPRSEGGEDIHYVLCNDLPTLVWVTNLGDIEKHVLLAQAPRVERPTSLVFDLDPGEGAGLLECAGVALELRTVLEGLGLQAFVKVSGSKGLHLNVPLNTAVTYEQTQPFAKSIAELLARQLPEQVVSGMARRARRGKVLIDWSQNSDFKTTVCVYALRARRGAPFISLPITWEELARAVRRKKTETLDFTPVAAVRRLRKLGDLFAPVLELKQKLPAEFTKALAAGPPPKLSRWPRNEKESSKKTSVRDKTLREYTAKRHADRTPEPMPKSAAAGKARAKKKGALRFVIQKHQASHLHYDFRLEMEGVLRSWAVPKGPPLEPREARLAMLVEDHPLEYADFEGTIPKGNYGAGSVMVWDRGTYENETPDPVAAFHRGKLHLTLRGEKLQGEWVLVKDRREEDSNKWLLLKAGDRQKLKKGADDTSVLTGRSLAEIGADNDAQWESDRGGKRTYGSQRTRQSA